ncbi:gastrin/cholecystokinin type B receptor-like, partial [Argonauta hians]
GLAFFTFSWTMGEILCKGVHYLQSVSMLCSVFTLMVISIERYIAIRHPLKAKYICTVVHTRLVNLAVWILAFIGSIPVLFGQRHIEVGVKRKAYYCIREWEVNSFEKIYELYMLIVMLIIPSIVMTITYLGICHEMWRVSYRRADMRSGSMVNNGCLRDSSGSRTGFRNIYITGDRRRKKTTVEDDKTKMQVVKMLVVVVVLFIICWAPILINNVMIGFGYLPRLNYGYLKPMRMAFYLMSYFNSCINPIVYSFMSKNFREKFKHSFSTLFRGRFTGSNRIWNQRGTASFTTRSSSLNRCKMHSLKDTTEKEENSSITENCKVVLVPD